MPFSAGYTIIRGKMTTGFYSDKTGIHYIPVNKHRRQWVVDRIRLSSYLFAIDVCSYAIMGNHYHLVLKLCPEQLDELSDSQMRTEPA
ncbi:MAG: hypothetical protein GY820_20850 [Gammaproteobacteria bacterium]|nr:hypothetical protein [Gammaproteobacteria bacterium]